MGFFGKSLCQGDPIAGRVGRSRPGQGVGNRRDFRGKRPNREVMDRSDPRELRSRGAGDIEEVLCDTRPRESWKSPGKTRKASGKMSPDFLSRISAVNVPRPARGGCAPGCRPLAWAPRGSSANPGYPVARDPVGPPQFASCFFGPFDTPSGTNPESAMGRLTEPAAMPLPGRADPRPGHLHWQHREAVSPSDEHRLR